MTELNAVTFPLQAEETLSLATILKLTGDCAVDPERQHLAMCGHFQRVPFASRFHAHVRHLLAHIERFLLAIGAQRLAKQVAVFAVSELSLMPDRAVLGITHVSAAVVTLFALDFGVAKLKVEDSVPDFLVEQQHSMPAVPVADQNRLLAIHMPLFPAQFTGGRHGHAIPAFEVRRPQNVHPTLRVAL